METSDHPHQKTHFWKWFFWRKTLPAPFDTLTTFSSQVLFAFPRDQNDLSWRVFSKLRLRSQHSFGSRVVQQFCKRHHRPVNSVSHFLLTCVRSRNTHGDVPIFPKGDTSNGIRSLFMSAETSLSVAAVKFVKQYFLFFFNYTTRKNYLFLAPSGALIAILTY